MKPIVPLLLAGALWSPAFVPACAQTYPARPVRLIVPFPPGGSVDYVARAIQAKFSEELGQTVVIDNRGGASGTIGTYEAARAAPDGYTLLMIFDTHTINDLLYKDLKYDTFKSFDYLSLIGTLPIVLMTSRQSGLDTLPKLLAEARAHPGKINYGTSGGGGVNHPNAGAFESAAGVRFTHVPYRGGGALLSAILSGEVDVFMPSLPTAVRLAASNQVHAVGVGTATRQPQLPDVPTIAEFLPGYLAESWVGLLAPAGLPENVASKIEACLRQALDAPEVKSKLQAEGFKIVAGSSREFEERARADALRWGKIVREQLSSEAGRPEAR